MSKLLDWAWVLLVGLTLVFALTFLKTGQAWAQHSHERYHNDYQNWSSEKQANCCNNQDCGEMRDEQVRATPQGYFVAVSDATTKETKWCPIKREHWITRGKSPNFTSYHACIAHPMLDETTGDFYDPDPCNRVLCFAGKGGT